MAQWVTSTYPIYKNIKQSNLLFSLMGCKAIKFAFFTGEATTKLLRKTDSIGIPCKVRCTFEATPQDVCSRFDVNLWNLPVSFILHWLLRTVLVQSSKELSGEMLKDCFVHNELVDPDAVETIYKITDGALIVFYFVEGTVLNYQVLQLSKKHQYVLPMW